MTKVTTETGSLYHLDKDKMEWARIKSEKSGYSRTEEGKLLSFPEIKIGEPLILMGPPFVDNAIARAIITSPVITIEEI